MKNDLEVFDTDNLDNNYFLKKLNELDEKSNKLFNTQKEYFDFEEEEEMIKIYKENSITIKIIVVNTKNIVKQKRLQDQDKMEKIKSNINYLTNYNNDITNQIKITEEKIADDLTIKLKEYHENFKTIYNNILEKRRNNFKNFDNRINFFYQSNKSIKILKKRLYLYINSLKLKLFDSKSINADLDHKFNGNNILGYFINNYTNSLIPLYNSSNTDEYEKARNFWIQFCKNF